MDLNNSNNLIENDLIKDDLTKDDLTKDDLTKDDLIKDDLTENDLIENDLIENDLTELETTKLLTILQSSFTDNYLISIIIGAGNTDSDLIRHQPRYNIALGGICLETNDETVK